MGLREELGDLYPEGGFEVEDPDALIAAVEEADSDMSEEEYQQHKGALDKAIASNERKKVILAALKFAVRAGATLKSLA